MLSDRDLAKLAASSRLVDPFIAENCEGATINLTLDSSAKRYACATEIVMGEPPNVDGYEDIDLSMGETTLQHGESILIQTHEFVRIPEDYSAVTFERFGVKSLGLVVSPAHYMNPGFQGRISLLAVNHGMTPIRLVPGIKICQIALFRLSSTPEKPYALQDGKYMGANEVSVSKLHLDREIQSYLMENGIGKVSDRAISNLNTFLMKKIKDSAKELADMTQQEGLLKRDK